MIIGLGWLSTVPVQQARTWRSASWPSWIRKPSGGQPFRPLLVLAILLAAVNMRPALAEVGPVLGLIHADTHLSGAGLALLTALPVICFGVLAPLAPRLARRWGLEVSLTAALLALAAGMALRLGRDVPALLTGTVVLGSGIAIINVLLPALVKRDFSSRAGLVTGMYTTALNLSATVAAASAVPLAAELTGAWRGAFAVWILPVVLALMVWVPMAHRQARPSPAAGSTHIRASGLLRNRRARQVIIFTTAQSVIYYSVLSWLPSIFESHGLSAASAGLLLSVTSLVSAPVALVLPTLAARRADQRGYIVFVAACATAGLLGLLAAPSAAPYVWAVLIGVAQGGAFPLALTLFLLRTRNSAETMQLSTVAQAIAYIVAAAGPLAMGILHDVTGSWKPGVALLIMVALVEVTAGLGAGRAGYLSSGHPLSNEDPEAPISTPGTPESGWLSRLRVTSKGTKCLNEAVGGDEIDQP